MSYLDYHNEERRLNIAIAGLDLKIFKMEMDEIGGTLYDTLTELRRDTEKELRSVKAECNKKYDLVDEKIIAGITRETSEIIGEAIGSRKLWHSFDSSALMLNPDLKTATIFEMLNDAPVWYFHLKKPGFGERHKNDILSDIDLTSINNAIKWFYDPAFYKYAHLYTYSNNILVSACGKAWIENGYTPQLFEGLGGEKCKLCERTKIARKKERELKC